MNSLNAENDKILSSKAYNKEGVKFLNLKSNPGYINNKLNGFFNLFIIIIFINVLVNVPPAESPNIIY